MKIRKETSNTTEEKGAPEPRRGAWLLTYDECAERLRCSRKTVENLVARKELRAGHFGESGRSRRVLESDLEGFIRKRMR